MRRICLFVLIFFIFSFVFAGHKSLVPENPSKAYDYFLSNCECSSVGHHGSATIEATALAGLDSRFRQDLIFVADQFDSMTKDEITKLSKAIKKNGWKGVGLSIPLRQLTVQNLEKDWIQRLKESQDAGISYWKMDGGGKADHFDLLRKLTDLGRQYAPYICIEQSFQDSCSKFCNVMSIPRIDHVISSPFTIGSVVQLLSMKGAYGYKSVINCGDEPYIAIGLGCAFGLSCQSLKQDATKVSSPLYGRNAKKRMDEVLRAARWHRIAEPFGVNGDAVVDVNLLTDYWILNSSESLPNRTIGDTVVFTAPARVSRNMPLPIVGLDVNNSKRPYILATRYPNGAVAVVAVERVMERSCFQEPTAVCIQVENTDVPIGIFGHYKELVINFKEKIPRKKHLLAQDLAGDKCLNISADIRILGNSIIIPGEVIERIGCMASTVGDDSAPGMVVKIE